MTSIIQLFTLRVLHLVRDLSFFISELYYSFGNISNYEHKKSSSIELDIFLIKL